MPNKYLDSVGLAEYTGLVKDYVDTKADDYLPLSGGTMTGAISTRSTDFITKTNNTTHLTIAGGSAYSNSASLRLAGGEESSQTGLFQLRAQNGTIYKDFVGKPDGTLTWGGNSVITSAGGTMSAMLNMNNNALNLGASSNADGRIYKISNLLRLTGGSNTSTGSYVDIGSASASTKGVKLVASDGNTTKELTALYNGTLTWDGNNVITAAGGTMTGNIVANRQFFEITNSTLNGRNSIYGGTSGTTGAFLYVYGKDHSNLAGNFILHANDGSNTSEIIGKPDGTLTWKGLDIAPQKWATATFSDKSVASSTRTNLGSFTLTKGTWLICIAVNFPSNANGYRDINISNSSAGAQLDRYRYYRCAPTNGSDTHITWTIFDGVTANTTRYVNVLQNSGSALTVGGGYIAFRLSNDA